MIKDFQTDFILYCVESLAEYLDKDFMYVWNLLDSCDLINSYLVEHYDVLSTQGKQWLVPDLIEQLEDCGVTI